jgi:hypothetical protein
MPGLQLGMDTLQSRRCRGGSLTCAPLSRRCRCLRIAIGSTSTISEYMYVLDKNDLKRMQYQYGTNVYLGDGVLWKVLQRGRRRRPAFCPIVQYWQSPRRSLYVLGYVLEYGRTHEFPATSYTLPG